MDFDWAPVRLPTSAGNLCPQDLELEQLELVIAGLHAAVSQAGLQIKEMKLRGAAVLGAADGLHEIFRSIDAGGEFREGREGAHVLTDHVNRRADKARITH